MQKSIACTPASVARRCCVPIMFVACLASLSGCGGPSQQELLLRSAQRVRGDDDPPPVVPEVPEVPEVSDQSKPDQQQQGPGIVAENSAAKPEHETGTETTSEKEPDARPENEATLATEKPVSIIGEEIANKSIVPIEERKPAQPLSDQDRRERAAENLKAIGDALLAYMKAKGRLPKTYLEANGFQTLSWRVEILPYLGYQDLYKKFDPTVPWNRPPNDALLQFIPDEYISPERFDVKTNIVMPSRRGFVGGQGGQLSQGAFEDGMGNTLLLVEVNDELAVDWTQPEDFAPKSQELAKAGVLGTRADGAFAVWANGWPVLLANELPAQAFWDAMTIDAGDGLLAGSIHRDIPIQNITEAAVAAAETPATPGAETASLPQPDSPAELGNVTREDVPRQSDLAAAQTRLKEVFAARIKDAKTDDDKSALATDMLARAQEMDQDPTGAFALQTAAIRLAIDAGSVKQMLAAIDQRIGRFEVDPYEENMKWMLAFGQGVAHRDLETIQGMDFVKRSVKVAHAAIHDDDYVQAGVLMRYAYRLVNQKRDEEIPKQLNRLKSLLGAAQREYDGAGDSLADFRNDPDNSNAAAAFGRFLCFIKGDWETGLPLLTKGGNQALQTIAALDLKGAKDHLNQVAIGDAWWELSEKARVGIYRQAAQDRAIHWYQQAFNVMPDSLEKLHVKARLDAAEDNPSSSPLALVAELAEDVGVDLTISLAAVADVGQPGGSRPYGQQVFSVADDYDPDG